MALWCSCRLIPSCEYPHCNYPAELTTLVPASWKLPLRLTAKFYCISCWEFIETAWKKPIPGIDRPAHASEDWRPSLMDMMRHARIAIAFQERNKRPPPPPPASDMDAYWHRYADRRGFTQPQRETLARMRELRRKHSMAPAHRGDAAQ